MEFHVLEPKSGKPPSNMVVLLHGYGSNGQDLISLAPYFQKNLPNTVFLSPNAPFPCEIMPESGFQWFSLGEYTPEKLLEGSKQAAPLLNTFIDEQLEAYNLTADKLALVGFSQGTMMSLYVAPRRNPRIAGVLGYSGALTGEANLPEGNLPIHLIHGESDSVVPVQAYHKAKVFLEQAGYPVTGHTTAYLDHSIDEQGIESGADFLEKVLL